MKRRYELRLPELGISEEPVVLSVWLVRRGERVAAGDGVVEVTAGPATVELPSPVDGRLIAALVDEDEPVAVGQRLAVIECEL